MLVKLSLILEKARKNIIYNLQIIENCKIPKLRLKFLEATDECKAVRQNDKTKNEVPQGTKNVQHMQSGQYTTDAFPEIYIPHQ